MPSIDVLNPASNQDEVQEEPSQQAIVGIIYPPPEVRNIVDKTASFVARNGPEFEARIRQNEIGNPKFNFLNNGDPYHAYYQQKVKDFREGKAQEPSVGGLIQSVQKLSVTSATQQKQQEILKQVEQPFVPKEPPSEFEFIADPPSISAYDLDVVKLTAQFVARNGRQFLTQLMNREQRNYQFDFLRPQHSLFQYFTKLLEQYTKILIPPKDLMKRLNEEENNMKLILEKAKYRADWIKHMEAQKRKEEEIVEKERVAYAQIDWHDFVVVETVDYQPYEIGNFPPPTTPEEVGARVLMQERLEEGEEIEMQLESDEEEGDEDEHNVPLSKMEDRTNERGNARDNNQVQDMEEESSSENEDESHEQYENNGSIIQPPLPPVPDKVLVKKYDPKQSVKVAKPTANDDYLISPITGTKIPASQIQEHMRIGLLDPRWLEQRDKHVSDKMNQETVYAGGSAIEASLKQLAERRTDIFGVGNEETAIGKKIGEEEEPKKDDRVTWDGHTSSVEAATRAARANITLEDQIHQIHKVKGLLPDEEKEKIGPKPVPGASNQNIQKHPVSSVSISKPQSTITQTKPAMKPPQQISMPVAPPPPVIAPPVSVQIPQPPHLLPPQPPMMMMPTPLPPMRPPPMMIPSSPFLPPTAMAPIPGIGAPELASAMKHAADTSLDEPVIKKQRTEDNLIPESEFLQRHSGPVTFKIQVPSTPEKSEWRLNGQIISLTLSLSDTIAAIKAKLHEEVGMPPAKQKISFEGMFFKDSNTLAFYNILPGAMFQLQVKERGGRKK